MRAGEDRLIEIRKVQPTDRQPIKILLDETNVFTPDEVSVALELIDTVLGDDRQQDYQIYSAIDEHGSVAGYYCIGPTPLTQSTYDLYWIAVKPSTHNRGIGKLLIRHAEETIRSHGGSLVIAETSSQPKYDGTRQFYLHNQYEEVARIRNYYRVGDDLVIYGKYLSQSGGN